MTSSLAVFQDHAYYDPAHVAHILQRTMAAEANPAAASAEAGGGFKGYPELMSLLSCARVF